MTSKKQRTIIAEYSGYKPDPETRLWYGLGNGIVGGFNTTKQRIEPLPDYCGDLNATAEVEKLFSSQQLLMYDKWLKLSNSDSARTCDFEVHLDDFTWSRTASQKAKAIIQTLTLWEE